MSTYGISHQRYYLDVALLAVAVILFRQLEEQGSVVATDLFGRMAVAGGGRQLTGRGRGEGRWGLGADGGGT